MNTTTQQTPSNPALDFAQSILDETNNGLELIEILRDIAEDCDEKANTNDRIAATNILNDRAFGKPPKQITPNVEPNPDPDDNDVGALREAPTLRESPSTIIPRKNPNLPGSSVRSTAPSINRWAPRPPPHSQPKPSTPTLSTS